MTFPFIPISLLIADVRSEMKRFDQVGEIQEEDCINWIVETMREIGGSNYQKQSILLKVTNNKVQLPSDFYLVDSIWLCALNTYEIQTKPGIPVWYDRNVSYMGTNILMPGDPMTGMSYTSSRKYSEPDKTIPSYIIRHPNQLRCSLPDAHIGLIYIALPQSENGQMLIQDEIHTIKAAKAYCKKMLLAERYYANQVGQNVWNDIKNDYETHLDQAQAIFKFPDPADDHARGYMQDHRYDGFKLK